jgi:hypothetical protein
MYEALQKAQATIGGCLGGTGGRALNLSFTVQNDGHAEDVQVSGASGDDERCVVGAIAAMRLPAFEGKPVPIRTPVNFYRPPAPAAPTPVAANVAAAPAAAPPPPPAPTSTTPYAPSTMPTTAPPGSDRTFIKP